MHYHELVMREAASSGKLIAYHGTGTRIRRFFQNTVTPHYFTQDKNYAMGYVGGKTPLSVFSRPKNQRNYLITVELNIHNMLDTKHDAAALEFYNTRFLPRINEIHQNYKQPSLPVLQAGQYVSFVHADDLYRYCTRFATPYDGMLVEEGIATTPAIVPFHADQIKVLKAEIVAP